MKKLLTILVMSFALALAACPNGEKKNGKAPAAAKKEAKAPKKEEKAKPAEKKAPKKEAKKADASTDKKK